MATDQEIQDRIAKLNNAIAQQRSSLAYGRTNESYMSRGRGNRIPYYGRSRNMCLSNSTAPQSNNLYNASTVIPSKSNCFHPKHLGLSKPPMSATSHNRTLVVDGKMKATSVYAKPTAMNKSQHRKLIINHKDNSTSTSSTTVQSFDATTGRKQVSINGVDFVVKGKKLVRKDLFDSNLSKTNLVKMIDVPKVLVRRSLKNSKRKTLFDEPRIPRKVSRTNKGNLVYTREPEGYIRQGRNGKSLVLKKKSSLPKTRYCGFYTRYGQCPKARHCPFVHDSSRRAICPRFLQGKCRKLVQDCRLSHSTDDPHVMPHCVHFQKGRCNNDPCMYIHVLVSSDAPVCKAFAMEGFCPKGLDCSEKHIHVCPQFAETGTCSNANCRLPHVTKRNTGGVIRLGSWVSPEYFYAQKLAHQEKKKQKEEALTNKVWTRPVSKEDVRDKEEEQGFVRLFDDSDDDGWAQYERVSEAENDENLRFNENDDEEDELDEEEDEHVNESEDSEIDVYEEISDEDMSDEEEEEV